MKRLTSTLAITKIRIFIILSMLTTLGVHCDITESLIKEDEQQACVIKLRNGLIRGNCSDDNYDSYTGIPYAKAPIGDLRLEAPQPIDNWSDVRNATEKVATCTEYSQVDEEMSGTEDCLKVHVYVPKGERPLNVSYDALMSIVFLYPGAFQFGDPTNNPDLVMKSGETILITLGYRTGPTGFLSTHTESLPGNLGLKDQRLAINWVLENIAAFGGDPKQILLLGDSAGSASVELHMITNTSDEIKAYGALSGSILNPWAFTTTPEIPAKRFAKLLNCSVDATGVEYKKCLKAIPIETIWKAEREMFKFYAFSTALFRPTIEPPNVPDAFLTVHPLELIKRGHYKDKPYLVGVVEGEGAFLASNLLQLNDNNIEVIEELNAKWYKECPVMFFYDEDKTHIQQFLLCDKLRRHYMCGKRFNIDNYKLLERMFSDLYFYNGIDESVKLHRKAGQKVYRYIADLPKRYNVGNNLAMQRYDVCFGSVHTADAFGIMPIDLGLPDEKNTPEQEETLLALIKLYKSMVLEEQPDYKDIALPANQNDWKPDQCLYLTYGEERLDKCGFPKVNCYLKPPSVKC